MGAECAVMLVNQLNRESIPIHLLKERREPRIVLIEPKVPRGTIARAVVIVPSKLLAPQNTNLGKDLVSKVPVICRIIFPYPHPNISRQSIHDLSIPNTLDFS